RDPPGRAAAVHARQAPAPDEGELRRLGHDLAYGRRIAPGRGTVEDHFGHRQLALKRFPARFEIDRLGETEMLFVLIAAFDEGADQLFQRRGNANLRSSDTGIERNWIP